MAYEFDGEAANEAYAYRLSSEQLLSLRSQLDEKLASLGSLGVKGHRVHYKVRDWMEVLPPQFLRVDSGSISRGDVFDVADGGDLTETFAASFLWGSGMTGYGPRRYREIVESAGDRLTEMLQAACPNACPNVIRAYTMFFGGPDAKNRVAPMVAPYARLGGFGPAFFTKFLYFTRPDALILDNVVANAVHKLSGMPFLVDTKGRSRLWSSYRYAVYLHWMNQVSTSLKCDSDELELTLFDPPSALPAPNP